MIRSIPPPRDTPQLNLQALQAFVLIASGARFNEAAALLHIDPSTITKLIRGLEQDLGGVVLVTRSRWSQELTEAGRAAVRPARAILAAAHRMSQVVQDPEQPSP